MIIGEASLTLDVACLTSAATLGLCHGWAAKARWAVSRARRRRLGGSAEEGRRRGRPRAVEGPSIDRWLVQGCPQPDLSRWQQRLAKRSAARRRLAGSSQE